MTVVQYKTKIKITNIIWGRGLYIILKFYFTLHFFFNNAIKLYLILSPLIAYPVYFFIYCKKSNAIHNAKYHELLTGFAATNW